MLEKFNEQFSDKLRDLNAVLDVGPYNYEQVASLGHAIKSMSANVGAASVRAVASDIEKVSKEQSEMIDGSSLDRLKLEHSRFIEEIKNY